MIFARDGAQRFEAGMGAEAIEAFEAALPALPINRAGIRLLGIAALALPLSVTGSIGAIAGAVLGSGARPVRAVLFDKNPAANWQLGWHQDRTIAVRARIDVAGFGPWSVKAGLHHVEPPFELLARMVTLRLHLDRVDAGNAPLLIAPGSHRLGRVPVAGIAAAIERCGRFACLAERGDAWLYATPILHASDAALSPGRRRVLQIDYAACELPPGLDWLGI